MTGRQGSKPLLEGLLSQYRGCREETISGKTRAVCPALDWGQISQFRRLGWTLLASSHTTTLCSGPPPLPDYLIALYRPVAWCHSTVVFWNHEGKRCLVNRLGMRRLNSHLPIIFQPITGIIIALLIFRKLIMT